MRKAFTLSAVLLFTLFAAFTTDLSAQEVIKLSASPKQLEVSTVITVELIPSQRNEMQVSSKSKESLEQFRHQEVNGKLKLYRNNRGGIFKFYRGDKSDRIYVKLYTTDINRIELIDVSGASAVHSDAVLNSNKLLIELSGASTTDLEGKFGSINAEVSGASGLLLHGSTQTIRTDTSGASRFTLVGDFKTIEADVSGASKFTIEGNGETAYIDVSGASNFDGRRCYVDKAKIDASGASSVRIHATHSDTDASGMSKIKIIDSKN